MKIYVSVDMEGMPGTLNWDQEKHDRSYVKQCMTQLMEWVILGVQSSKVNQQVEEILVADSHGGGDSLPYEFTAMDRRLRLVSGSPRPCYMMPVLDGSYDVVFFAGYHSGAGACCGIMDHTYTGCFHSVSLNGRLMSEALMNAAYAGWQGVPVGLVIGDEALRLQLQEEDGLPWARYVTTKTGLSRFAADSRPLEIVREETMNAVQQVLAQDLGSLPRYRVEQPARMTIELLNSAMADIVAMVPGVRRLDGRTVELAGEDFGVLYNARTPLGQLAGLYR
ncbi:MAG TPA: M55 family metallopeptidase [Selenomonadales bacterium]|nr:M55 family metallopeptidase [Selenomonadales bacterium]